MANSRRSVQPVDSPQPNINAEFIESVKREWKAIDHLKNELMKTDAKIRRLGKESSSVQFVDIEESKVRKRKIAWSASLETNIGGVGKLFCRAKQEDPNCKCVTFGIKDVHMLSNSIRKPCLHSMKRCLKYNHRMTNWIVG